MTLNSENIELLVQIDWAHLVRYRMHKALRANVPLPYPHFDVAHFLLWWLSLCNDYFKFQATMIHFDGSKSIELLRN